MKKPKKNKGNWSKKFFQLLIGVWNCWSLSNERCHYCESLKCDVLGPTELHDTQTKEIHQGRRWVCSTQVEEDDDGKSTDPEAGVTILFSPRVADKVVDQGHVGTRIVWVKITGPVCNTFYIVTYMYQMKDGHKHHKHKTRWDN